MAHAPTVPFNAFLEIYYRLDYVRLTKQRHKEQYDKQIKFRLYSVLCPFNRCLRRIYSYL